MAKKSTTKKAATPKAAPHKTVSSGDDAPDAKKSTKAQQDAAEKLFQGADSAIRTQEQHENHVRRQALGY